MPGHGGTCQFDLRDKPWTLRCATAIGGMAAASPLVPMGTASVHTMRTNGIDPQTLNP